MDENNINNEHNKPLIDFITELENKKFLLRVEGEGLRYKAPKEAVTPEILECIKARKQEIMGYLKINKPFSVSIQPIQQKEQYLLSAAQKRMFILNQMDKENTAYNLTQVLKVTGLLDKEKVEWVIKQLIKRHESLRTSFEIVNDEPIQRIHDDIDFKLDYDEVEGKQDTFDNLINDFIKPYDLGRAPLFRIKLVKLGNTGGIPSYLVLYDMHHIISDGVSAGILIREINELYAGKQLPELKIQYKDYTAWHENLLASSWIDKQRKYWLEQFAGDMPVLELPTDFPRTGEFNYEGENVKFRIGRELTSQLYNLALNNRTTLYSVVLAAYYVLLSKYTDQYDIIVGTPSAGRRHTDSKNIIGMFVNTLALRGYPEPGKTFEIFLKEVSENVLSALENQDYPFEKLIEDLNIQRSAGRNPLFDTMFVLQNMDIGDFEAHGLKTSNYEFPQKTSQFDIRMTLTEKQNEIYIELNYSTQLFKKDTMERFISRFVKVLEEAVKNPLCKIGDICILTTDEYEQILYKFNNTASDYPRRKTIHEIFEEQVERTPDNIAVKFEDREITYRQLNDRANQLARVLREKGVKADSIVGIMVERSMEMIIGIMAILKAGGAYLPIDPEYPMERIRFMIQDSGINILLTQNNFMGKVDFEGETLILENKELYCGDTANIKHTSMPESLAYIIYTSGTTGRPKGVMIEHRNVVRLMFNDKMQFDFKEDDVWTMFHSYCFDFSVWEMYGALLYGGKLIVVPKMVAKEMGEFLKLLQKEKVTVLNQTPTAFYNLSQEEVKIPTAEFNVRYVVFGGEALKPLLLKAWKERYPQCKLINMYGITETTVHVTYKEITEKEIESNISNIGKPIPTLTAYIMDANQKLLPVGIPGELCVGGEGLGRGYLNRPELTSEKFVQNPYKPEERIYKSGDQAMMLPNGDMVYYGRIDRQVKIRGHRIELGEIENKLLMHKLVKEAVVLTREDNAGNRYLCAYIVSDNEFTVSQMRAYLLEELPEYMIPSYFMRIDKIPMTSNGKVDRKSLPKPDGHINTGVEYQAPGNEVEKRLAQIWSQILGAERVGTNENFFILGGDSIRAISLISRINKEFQTNIQMKDLYINQTIRELSFRIGANGESVAVDELTKGLEAIEEIKQSILDDEKQAKQLPENYEDFYPLSQIQHGMVFYSKLRPDEPIYHDQFIYTIKLEGFDCSRFFDAIEMLADRHPILRTSFITDRFNRAIQVVHRKRVPQLICEDIIYLILEEQEEYIKAYLKEDLLNKFRFDNDLLWRLRMFKLSEKDYSMVLCFQHAILDGWSVATMLSELFEIYSSLEKGCKYQVKELKSSYKDYVAINLSREKSEKSRSYWKETLKGYERNKLPFNFSGKRINSVTGSAIYRRNLGTGLLKRLEEKARQYGCTLKDICLSAHLYLLSIITTEKDIVTGVVTHDRPVIEDGEKILGCFLNTLPMRIGVECRMNKLELIKAVKQYLVDSKPHELFLADIASIIGEAGSSTGNPIFDTLFNFTDFHVMDSIQTRDDIKVSDYNIHIDSNEMTNTLFDLEVSKVPNNLIMQIKYSPNYFYSTDIETAFILYCRILERITCDDCQELYVEDIMTQEEKKALIYDFNNTVVEYAKEKTIHQLFEEQVRKTPDKTALVFEDREMSYGELNKRANQLAKILIEEGVKCGDNVGLIAYRGFEMIIGMLAILKAGGAYVPIDPDYPAARREYIAENSKVSVVVADNDYEISFSKVIKIDFNRMDMHAGENIDIPKDSRELAYIIYTSGSTGLPKGVMIEHHSAVNLISWVNKTFNVGEKDILLFITSMCFDLSVYDIFGMLASGGSIVIAKKEQVQDPNELIELVQKEKITFWDSVPSTMNHLITSIEERGIDNIHSDLRIVFLSGDWIPVRLPERIGKYFPKAKVISLGGATEGTVWSIYYPIEEIGEYQTSIPYGRPIDNNYFYILDDNRNIVPYGIAGELYIGGVGVARGYANDEARTNASFVENRFIVSSAEMMYKTGDLGRMLPDGNIEFLGRKDHQVKIRGYRVELGEIENRLLKHESIKEAVVVDRNDTGGNKYLCGYIVSDREIPAGEVKKYLSEDLPDYMIPTYIVMLDKLPLTPNGKIDRKSLPEPSNNISTGVEYEAPQNKIEEKLVDIWREILEVDRISISDDFFELGGHSLKATTLVSKIHKEFNVEVPLREIFSTPTIKQIAKRIEDSEVNIYSSISPVETRQYYPVSAAQKRMYILNRLEGGTSYNMPGAIEIDGELDKKRLEETFEELIKRHEALRTSFEMVEGQPVQRIHETANLKIIYLKAEEHEVDGIINEFIRPFELNKAPLLRAGVIELSRFRHILMFDMHHIISDGTSMGILTSEFIKLYNGKKLPELRIQYKEFSEWQNRLLKSARIREQEEYWLKTFSGEIPVLNIPTDYPRPTRQSFEGDSISIALDSELTGKLTDFAVETGTTTYMVFLAVYNILLYKYTGQEDIVIGSPIAGRPHSDLENIIGMFVNTLPMRNYPSGAKTFREFLGEVKENCLKAYDNQDYQFDELVEKLDVKRDISRNPLFDTMFIMQNIVNDVNIDGLQIKPYNLQNNTAKFDITVSAVEIDGKMQLNFEFCKKLFTKATMEKLANHFGNIIRKTLEKPNVNLFDIEMLSDSEKERLLYDFNSTSCRYPIEKTIHELFEEQVQKAPDSIAVRFEGKELTYRELNEKANQLAWVLREKGASQDKIIGITIERSLEMMIAIVGVLKSGAAYLPIDPSYPDDRVKYMLKDSRADILLVSPNTKKNVEFEGQIVDVKNPEIFMGNADSLGKTSAPKNLAYVIYTSGSTGLPKGVMIEHRAVNNFIKGITDKIEFTPDKTILCLTTISFDIFVLETLLPLTKGMKIVLAGEHQQTDMKALAELILKEQVDMIQATPSRLQVLIKSAKGASCIKRLKKVMVGGEALPKVLLEELKRLETGGVYNMYGPTETTVWSSVKDLSGNRKITIGKPIANTRMYILDSKNNLQPIGVFGELYIAGDGLARGYLGNWELTAERFVADPFVPGERMYRTGDLARWLNNGEIEFQGRTDHQVKIRGYRIELEEIESLLMEFPGVKEAAVAPKEDSNGNKYLSAYIVSNCEIEVSDLREYLSKGLPEYMIPSYFVMLDKLPQTPNGKIDRRLLPDPNLTANIGTEYAAPVNDVEKEMVKIWEEVLGIEKVGVNDKFFELGGHSLKAMAVVSAIYNTFNVEVPFSKIFESQTVRELARYIEAIGPSLVGTIKPIGTREYYPVSAAQKRLLILSRMEPYSTAYNMPSAVLIEGSLDLERMEKSFQQLINRHESLRTSFEFIEGMPVQRVHEHVDFKIEFLEQGCTDVEQLMKYFVQPFDLGKAPLLRGSIVKYNHSQYILLFDMHHVISDGASLNILIEEAMMIYRGMEPKKLKTQYKDFAVWQQALFETDTVKRQEKYWLDRFSGEIPVLNMPCDYIRPSIQNFDGDSISIVINRDLTEKIKKAASDNGTTVYTVLLAVYNTLLFKYTGQQDIVVGSPIAGRDHPDLENVIGMFANTLAMRNYPDGDKTFMEFLGQVKENCLKAYENQYCQFDELVEKLNLKRDLSRNPLFDTMFVLQNFNTGIQAEGLKINSLKTESRTAKFDITVSAVEINGKLEISFEYCTKLFDKQTIVKLAKHFENIAGEIAEKPYIKLGDIDMLCAEEKQKLLFDFNTTQNEYPRDKSIHQMFEEQVRKTPYNTAVIYEDSKLTYKQLNEKANRIAWLLREKGVADDTVVGVMMERSTEMIIGIMGILKAGGAYLPIDPDYPEERINYLLSNSNTSLLLTQGKLRQKAESIGTELIAVDEVLNRLELPDRDLNLTYNPERLMYVLYTSGSTGKPKGVMIKAHAFVNLLSWFTTEFNIDERDCILLIAPTSFDLAQKNLYAPLIKGGCLCLFTAGMYDYNRMSDTVERAGVTIINCTPSAFYPLVDFNCDSSFARLKTLRHVFLGGEPINTVKLAPWIKSDNCSCEIVNTYGPTECTDISSFYRLANSSFEGAKTIPIGKPVYNTRIYILDKYLNPVPQGVTGELCIGGVGVARAYYNDSVLTAQKFVGTSRLPDERIYKTGDLARWMPDGNIEFLGRMDYQVKIRGYRIELEEIEAALLKIEVIKEALVIDREDRSEGKYLCAYVVADGDLNVSSLKEFLSGVLPSYMIPSKIVQLEKMPLTPNGKIDRKALPQPIIGVDTGIRHVEPRNETEQKLTEIWKEILQLERISIEDNFFELGGHSLKGVTLTFKIQKELDTEVSLTEVFNHPTVKELAEYIQSTGRSGYSPIKSAEKSEYYPLSSAQRRLFAIEQLEGIGTTYNIPTVMLIEGNIKRIRIEDTFKTLVKRHEAFRTSFGYKGGDVVQVISRNVDLTVEYAESDESNAQEIIKGFIRPFDLSIAPLFRVGLIQLSQDRHLLLVDMHHIISDGTSVAILMREFMDLYQGGNDGELRIQYKDFTVWQREMLQSEAVKKQEAYWMNVFSDGIPVLNMPTDYQRPSIQSFEGDSFEFELSEELSVKLKNFALESATTLYMVLLAAYNVLLYKYSGQEDIVVGSPIAGRKHPDLQNIIGMFVNTLPMRNYPSSHKTFKQFLEEVKENSLLAYENQDYQFEELVEKLGIKRDMSRNPLFDTMMADQNMNIPEIRIEGLTLSPYRIENKISRFDFILYTFESENLIRFYVEYCTRLYKNQTIKRFADSYIRILETVVNDKNIRLGDIELEKGDIMLGSEIAGEVEFNF
ncbi:MAG: amino acid adenylation domain-containing protein [Clostridia bacterium]|nr:amino acid adenylation domain-containing protein [Clostridia bacterium]